MIQTEIVIKTVTKLIAEKGHFLTNGTVYGKEVYLADGDSPDNWYEITDAEYTTFETAEQEKISQEIGD